MTRIPEDQTLLRLARQIALGRVVAVTGAGISTASGLPDFRTPKTGMWSQVDPQTIANIQTLEDDPERFWSFYAERFESTASIEPNAAHLALTELEELGLLDYVVTQNVDGLHQAAGQRHVLEMHGRLDALRCISCNRRYTRAEVAELKGDDGVPRCTSCTAMGFPGVIRPGIVLFGEMLPPGALMAAYDLVDGCETLLAIGSSLVVAPVSNLPALALHQSKQLAVMTTSDTPFDSRTHYRLRGELSDSLPRLVELVKQELGA